MDFSVYFQNVIWQGGGAKFVTKKNSEKAKHSQICPSLVVMWAKPNSVTALLSHSIGDQQCIEM